VDLFSDLMELRQSRQNKIHRPVVAMSPDQPMYLHKQMCPA